MAHEHGKNDHHHGHDHGHHDGHDHHDHEHHDHHHHDDDHGDHHHHEWQSEHYVGHWVENDARRQAERQPIIDRLIAAVPFGPATEFTVLDVGAGAGAIADALLRAFPRARMVLQDFSAPMLAHARARFSDRGDQV